MLEGRDVSQNNTDGQILAALEYDFIGVKATEGNGAPKDPNCVDPKHDSTVEAARKKKLLVLHYHFCHIENNPIDEADWFVKYANPIGGDCVMADLEPYYTGDLNKVDWAEALEWLLSFCSHLQLLTGAVPVVYLNDDVGHRLLDNADPKRKSQLLNDFVLCKAKPDSDDIGDTFGFKRVLFWQYSITDIDKDRFLGDREAWQVIAVPEKEANMAMKGPQYNGYPVFGYPKLCETWQIEAFVAEALALPTPPGTSLHALEYDVISAVHDTENSWHYWFDRDTTSDTHALAVDFNLEGTTEQAEFEFLRANVAPLAKKWGLAITCPIDSGGYGVPGHSIGDGLHCHADTGSWSNTGTGDVRFASWNKRLPSSRKPRPVVQQGDSGNEVKHVQWAVGVNRDGIYGPKTEQAVKQLQRRLNFVNRRNIDVDGKWGPKTAAAYKTFCDGVLGEGTIRLWQHNAGTPVDGRIDRPSTLIEKVQREDSKSGAVRPRYKLTGKEVDGILGPKTWRMLQDLMGFSGRNIDGIPGEHTVTRLQQRLLRGRY